MLERQAGIGGSGGGCTKLIAVISAGIQANLRAEAEAADVGSLRVEDESGFLIYGGAEGTVFAIPVVKEGGGWKLAGLAGLPLT